MKQKNEQFELARAIWEKCKDMNLKDETQVAGTLAGATLHILRIISDYLGMEFDDARAAYVRALLDAELKEKP